MDSSPEPTAPFYAELHCISNFTFLRGASHPEELVERASALGYSAIALTDECSLSGIVRAHVAATERIKLIVGSEFVLDDGLHFVLLATDRVSYGRLSHLISVARRGAEKGSYFLDRALLQAHLPVGCCALWVPGSENSSVDEDALLWLRDLFFDQIWIAVELHRDGHDRRKLKTLQRLGSEYAIPLCAAGDAHMHVRSRQVLQDTVTAIRQGVSVPELGYRSCSNGEKHLRERDELQTLYPPALLQETLKVAERCDFSLNVLRQEYQYPRELVPQGYTAQSWLRHLTEMGAWQHWPRGVPGKVRRIIERELELIAELQFEAYFLTVYDIVKFARSRNILCQGRGSAANSVICYCLQITAVDPGHMEVLFERFISRERNEPPDIDVDFEHERREEVIQYIYDKYGRDRAALAATVITYRTRSAIRDVGKALGLAPDQIDHIAKSTSWWDNDIETHLQNAGYGLDGRVIRQFVHLVNNLKGFPRHLSQHVGGFVISEGRLTELVPVENAAMADRSVIQWEKDDLESLGLMKVDVLALGMLTAIRKALNLVKQYEPLAPLSIRDIPREDPKVYGMMQKADTVGVFQIESRAQMSMLPRLRPANYYDLVIQIAIVRPGPIQGDMVHPYLARRNGTAEVSYPSEAVEKVLARTLGIPIFQEQVMHFAMVAADYTPGEADQLRRDMAAWKRKGGLEPHREKLFTRMQKNGYSEEYAARIFEQIKGFGDYGFPESHSASFAHLAYISSWLKLYHPAAFACALINSWPMGFYRPDQLVQDARRHDVEVLPVDVNRSEWDCTLETGQEHEPRLRLGFRMISGLAEKSVALLCTERQSGIFTSIEDLAGRVSMPRSDIECLAAGDALRSLSGNRHAAFWSVSGIEKPLPLFPTIEEEQTPVLLREPGEGEEIFADYAHTGLTLRQHPVTLIRGYLNSRGIKTSSCLWQIENDKRVGVAGVVIGRQRPGTASGVVFVTLEDETGLTNVIVWPKVAEKQRKVLLLAQVLEVRGTVQQEDGVLHVIAHRLIDLSDRLISLQTRSRDFH